MDIDIQVVQNFLIALAIGALVGIEREKNKRLTRDSGFGGLRTFILVAQTGAVSSWLSLHLQSPWIFLISLLAISAFMLMAYRLENRDALTALGLTSEISAIMVYLLGGAVMFGYATLAVPLAILTSAILTFKQPLHGLVDKLASDDWVAGIKLLIATFIVLPLLPNHPIDPWQTFNPYKIWLLVILISSLSLVGYIAVRLFGAAKGTMLAGVTGGLVSSTAVSLSFARLSQTEQPIGQGMQNALAAGILWAWVVMCIRVLLMVALLHYPMFLALWPTMAVMAALTLAAAWYYSRAGQADVSSAHEQLHNPFSLLAATQFGLLFAVVLFVVGLTEHFAPAEALYWVALVAGIADVDAIALSMTELARQVDKTQLAASALVLAVLSNTVTKTVMVATLGAMGLRQRLVKASALIVPATLVVWWFV